jgi:hypothetical protein
MTLLCQNVSVLGLQKPQLSERQNRRQLLEDCSGPFYGSRGGSPGCLRRKPPGSGTSFVNRSLRGMRCLFPWMNPLDLLTRIRSGYLKATLIKSFKMFVLHYQVLERERIPSAYHGLPCCRKIGLDLARGLGDGAECLTTR